MKRMLFEISLSGHRMEYIHHIYMGMKERRDDILVIVVPYDFEKKKELYDWPQMSNVKFCFLSEAELQNNRKGSLIRQSFWQTRVLKKYITQEKAETVFLISLMDYIIALPFLIHSDIKVSGIIYSIYLYIWDSSPWQRRLQDVCKYFLMRQTACLTTIFILNDSASAVRLNKLYHTKKFKFLTDPFNKIDYQPRNIRVDLGVHISDKMFLHFGGLSRRKGTLDFLNAIMLLPVEERKRCVFIFAGKIYETIKEEFYGIVRNLPEDTRILIYDEFCSNEFLSDLCASSDFIVAPYHETNRSSGLLGYAAIYKTPIIGPENGLVGQLINKYKLGETLNKISPESIANKICGIAKYRVESNYNEVIQVKNFYEKIINV